MLKKYYSLSINIQPVPVHTPSTEKLDCIFIFILLQKKRKKKKERNFQFIVKLIDLHDEQY